MNKLFTIVLREGFWFTSAFIVAMIIAFASVFLIKLTLIHMGLLGILFLMIFIPVLIVVWIHFREEYIG
ncbi:hypothetical protein vBSscSF1_76 [Staphylococcus phage vB-SscS-F1]|nr:hypothetical protein vBApySJF1_76 [Arcanobacterium phage vB-ApyS-JF1]